MKRNEGNTSLMSIYLLAFITGASVMILELAGTRLITPYFGATIYTWTSLIGVVLASLSIGYILGGWIADKYKSIEILLRLVLLSSISCLLIVVSSNIILETISNKTENVLFGSLISTIGIFMVPSIVLGTITPYCAKLAITSLEKTGRIAGRIYGISTLGSIVGTFLTGYILFGVLGIYQIMLFVSILLLFSSFFIELKKINVLRIIVIMFIAGVIIYEPKYSFPLKNSKIREIFNTVYGMYFVGERNSRINDRSFRFLASYKNEIVSGVYLNEDNIVLADYMKYFDIASCFQNELPVLLLGGGAYIYPMLYTEKNPNQRIDVIEIDHRLEEISRRYFGLSDKNDKNIRFITGGARRYLNQNKIQYKAILVDVAVTSVVPYQLASEEAVKLMHNSLGEGGVVVMNLISGISGKRSKFLNRQINTFDMYFSHVEAYKLYGNRDESLLQNVVIVAYKANTTTDSKNVFQTCKSNIVDENKRIDNFEQTERYIITDNYSPIEYYLYSPY